MKTHARSRHQSLRHDDRRLGESQFRSPFPSIGRGTPSFEYTVQCKTVCRRVRAFGLLFDCPCESVDDKVLTMTAAALYIATPSACESRACAGRAASPQLKKEGINRWHTYDYGRHFLNSSAVSADGVPKRAMGQA